MNFLLTQVLLQIIYAVKLVYPVDVSHHFNGLSEIEHVRKPIIPILKHSFEQHRGGYDYSYETGNGIQAQESGYIKHTADKKHEILVQQGTITYHDQHGHPITLTYIADEHGFRPQGAHLPTPPPIPAGIQKVIDSQHYDEEQEIEQEEEGYENQHQMYIHH